MKSGRQSKSLSNQHFSKFWVQESNTTKNGSRLRPPRRSRREKEKKTEINNSRTRARKARDYKTILMLARQPRRA